MADELYSYQFTTLPESEQLELSFQLRGAPQQVSFLVPARALSSLIADLQEAQRRYKHARDQHIRNRKKQIAIVVKFDRDD